MIYLDNASTTYIYPEVIEKIYDILKNNWGNPSNIYSFGFKSKEIIDGARITIAKCIGAKPENIFFTSGSSEGNAWALKQGTKCLCSPYEHHNITENANSIIADEDYLERTLNQDWTTKSYLKQEYKNWVYSHMLVSNETGEIFDVNPLFKQAKQLEMFTHCDMTQALSNVPIYMDKFPDVDMATFSGHKVHAPKGVGFVYISDKVLEKHYDENKPEFRLEPLIYGGIQERNLRAGTENIAYIAGLAIAVDRATSEGMLKNITCIHLRQFAKEKLDNSNLDYYIVEGKHNIASTFTFCLKNIESEVIQNMLSEKNIFIGTGSACGDGTMSVSETLKYMEVPIEYIHGEIRLSFDLTTTEEDIDTAINAIEECYEQLQ